MKKEVYQLLNNLENRLGTAGRIDFTQIPRGERHEIIKGHAVRWLSGLHDDDRVRVIDEVVLLKMGGTGYRSMESRSGYEQQYGPELADWPIEAKDRYLRNMLISWMADLEPDELRAIDQEAKEGKH